MSFWKILTSPGGIEGARASVSMAVKTNLHRATGNYPFERRTMAVSATLTNRYRVVRRPFDPTMIIFEAAPLAWPEDDRIPRILGEYIVDQEFPGQSQVWLSEMMPELLDSFFSSDSPDLVSAHEGIFVALSSNRIEPHWLRWITASALETIYDRGRANLKARRPDLFDED